jgi:hypothetical protein
MILSRKRCANGFLRIQRAVDIVALEGHMQRPEVIVRPLDRSVGLLLSSPEWGMVLERRRCDSHRLAIAPQQPDPGKLLVIRLQEVIMVPICCSP